MLTLRDHRPDGYGLDVEKLPRNLKEALAAGSAYFFTGLPCRHGHVAARYSKGGSCSVCQRQSAAKRRGGSIICVAPKVSANRTRRLALHGEQTTYVPNAPCKHGHSLRWVHSNNCVECDAEQRKGRRLRSRAARIQKLYGLDAEGHERLVQKQGCACAICATIFADRKLMHVDHCHTTGKVRGLLCSKCNQALGLFNDSPAVMARAVEYINAHAS